MPGLFPSVGDDARPALLVGAEALSRRELLRRARAHARRLLDADVRPGDRVGVVALPTPSTVAALLGHALVGIVSVPLNPALGARELAHVLSDASPRLVLSDDPQAFPGQGVKLAPIATDGPTAHLPAPPGPDAPLLLLYTSGTTGAPKGALLTHDAAAFDLDALAEAWGHTPDDQLCHALPLFHVHGLVLGLFGPLRAGMPLRLLPRFSAEAIVAAFEGGASVLYAVPTMYHRLLEPLEQDLSARAALARARLLVSGSAALPAREHVRIAELTGQRIAERYGLTETLILTAARFDGPRRPGEVGPPLPGVELQRFTEEGEPAAEDELGEIAVKGRSLFAGYWNRPDATAAALDAEGRFRTGDLATRAPDGALRIAGRKATDLIKTGGYKVGAGEVEGALLEHPLVAEAAVLGLPDPDLGEAIAAWVVLRPGAEIREERLVEHVAGQIAWHKRPRRITFVTALPRNAMGKVEKAKLRAGGAG